MRTTARRSWASRLALLAAVPVLALSACGGGDAFDEDSGSSGSSSESGGGGGEITVGGADFTEMLVMQELYRLVLEDAGYTVDVKSVGQREVYAPALESGEIDVVPDYAATMAEYLNREKNGPDAEAIATSDAGETVEAMTPLAEEKGLTVLEPSGAARRQRLLRHPGVRRAERPDDPQRPRRPRPTDHDRGRRRVHRAAVLRHRPHRDLRHPGRRRHR